jgi:hypothetical protein
MYIWEARRDIESRVAGWLVIGVDAQEEIEIPVAYTRQIVPHHTLDYVRLLPTRDEDRNAALNRIAVEISVGMLRVATTQSA